MKRLILCLQDAEFLPDSADPKALRRRLDSYWRRADVGLRDKNLYRYVGQQLGLTALDSIPLAAFAALASLESFVAKAWYAFLDPVHLLPDRDTLLLLPSEQLQVEDEEARQLIRDIAEFNREAGWTVYFLDASHWLLQIDEALDLHCTDIQQATRGKLIDVLPRGPHAAAWRKSLNELQMFLHAHGCNQRRQGNGLPSINSVWLWGEGRLPAEHGLSTALNAAVISDNRNILGMAKYHNIHQQDVAAEFATIDIQQVIEQALALLSRRDASASEVFTTIITVSLPKVSEDKDSLWLKLRQTIMEPLRHALATGRVDEVLLYLDTGFELLLNRRLLRKLWRSF